MTTIKLTAASAAFVLRCAGNRTAFWTSCSSTQMESLRAQGLIEVRGSEWLTTDLGKRFATAVLATGAKSRADLPKNVKVTC